MNGASYKYLIFQLICCLLALTAMGAASDFEEGIGYTAVKAGMIGSGQVKLEGEQADQSAGFGIGLQFDFPFGERLHYGAAIELWQMNWTARTRSFDFDESELLLDVGITMKTIFRKSGSPLAFRPGVGVGFGALRRLAGFNGSNFLTLRAFGEFVYFPTAGPGWLIEAGVWHAPSGGDSETDMTIGPLLTLRAGLLF